MNKLIMNNKDDISDLIITEDTSLKLDLNGTNKNINIMVMEDNYLDLLILGNDTNNKEHIIIKENSKVIINKIGKDSSDDITIDLDGERSSVIYSSSLLNYKDNNYKQTINHHSSKTNSEIYNYAVNFEDRDLNIDVDAVVNKESSDCLTNQENRIINIGCGKNYIKPNLIVDNNLISASHSAYIGKFDDDALFYLKCRGISEQEGYQLLIKGFLLAKCNLNNDYKDEVIKFINDNIK